MGYRESSIEIHDHRPFTVERIEFPNMLESGGHGGSDDRMMAAFIRILLEEAPSLTTAHTYWNHIWWTLPQSYLTTTVK